MTEEPKKENSVDEKTEAQKAAEQSAKEMQDAMQTAPGGVKILAFLFTIGGIMWFIYPILVTFNLIFIPHDLPFYQWASQLICCWIGSLILAGLYFGIAGGLIKGMPGAWMWALIFAIFGLFNAPWGTIISIIAIIYLFKVKDYFQIDKMQQTGAQ
ncbi:MAG: hypothetical protein GXO25_03700 [Euryarchaeota archaeon]|nr:hypothetical protein [Euryarchaeota archaeon]